MNTTINPMNVLYVLNSTQIGGANRSMICLWEGLKDTNYHPLVICLEAGPMIEILAELGIAYEVMPAAQPALSSPFPLIKNMFRFIRYLKLNRIALVHANDVLTARLFTLAARMVNAPLLCHIHYDQGEELHRWVFRNLPRPKGFLFCSQGLQKAVGPRFESYCPRSFQEVVYNAVDLDRFPAQSADNPVPRIGIIANLWKVKGHEDFLEMASQLINQGRDLYFDIVGDDLSHSGRTGELKAHARSLGIADRVMFHGYVADVSTILGQLDILVCASHVEPFGICLIEAMASGKPIVATAVGGIVEVIEHKRTGILVEPHRPSQLARAVANLLDDDQMRSAYGKNGRKRVETYFSREVFSRNIRRAYERALS